VTKNPIAAKETIGDGGGRKYANSQFSDQNRQDGQDDFQVLFVNYSHMQFQLHLSKNDEPNKVHKNQNSKAYTSHLDTLYTQLTPPQQLVC
jgi:hypothetical protein